MNRNLAPPLSAREWGALNSLIRENNLPKLRAAVDNTPGLNPTDTGKKTRYNVFALQTLRRLAAVWT